MTENHDAEWEALRPPLSHEFMVERLRELIRFPAKSRAALLAKIHVMGILGRAFRDDPKGSIVAAWERRGE